MKYILILATLFSSSLFARELSTYCDDITLFADHKIVHVNLTKEGKLSSDKNFSVAVNDVDGNEIQIEGIKAEVLKSTLIDSTVKTRFGLGGPSTTYSEVYGMKLKISAEENIGQELMGCIMRPVKQVEVYGICTESFTKFGRDNRDNE